MIALLLIDSDESYSIISKTISPFGFETVRYRLPLKLMDNIDELHPDILIINSVDFPRQWKVVVQYLKGTTKKEIPTILLKNSFFTQTEADKALELGIKALVSESLEDTKSAEKLKEVLLRYSPEITISKSKTISPSEKDNVQCLISHPNSGNIITGKIVSLSKNELNIIPDVIASIEDIDETTLIDCTLKLDKDIINPKCFLIQKGKVAHLFVESITPEEQKILELYLVKRISQIV